MLHYFYNPLKEKTHDKNAKKQVRKNLLQFGEKDRVRCIFRIGQVKFYYAVKEILCKDNTAELSILAILLLLDT